MADLFVLPTDPMPAVGKIVNHLRGIELQPPDELAHCGLHLAAVALSFIHKHPQPVMCATCPSGEAAADALERHLMKADGLFAAGADAIPWQLILQIAMQILQLFAKK